MIMCACTPPDDHLCYPALGTPAALLDAAVRWGILHAGSVARGGRVGRAAVVLVRWAHGGRLTHAARAGAGKQRGCGILAGLDTDWSARRHTAAWSSITASIAPERPAAILVCARDVRAESGNREADWRRPPPHAHAEYRESMPPRRLRMLTRSTARACHPASLASACSRGVPREHATPPPRRGEARSGAVLPALPPKTDRRPAFFLNQLTHRAV
jgi:hypothetical protein